nr:unnamed protein product [Callosobruchus chinensis]
MTLGVDDGRSSVTVYKRRGQKNDILMYKRYEYKMERTSTHRLMWCCTKKETLKCRARVVTFGKVLFIKYMDHNHAPMLKKGLRYMELKMTLGKSSERKHPRRKNIKDDIKEEEDDDDQATENDNEDTEFQVVVLEEG